MVMSATSLRPSAPARFRRSRVRLSVEALQERHEALVAQRQELRRSGGEDAALERNRIQIARCQFELAHALIERYLPRRAARSAA